MTLPDEHARYRTVAGSHLRHITMPAPSSNKQRLLRELLAAQEIFNLTWLAMIRLKRQRDELSADPPLIMLHERTRKQYVFPLQQCIDAMRDEDRRAFIYTRWQGGLMRQLVSTTHLEISTYAGRTKQLDTYRAQPWYEFSRVIRNLSSHHIPKLGRRELGKVDEARWRDRVITRGMDVRTFQFSEVECLELARDQYTFAATQLK